MYDLHFEVVGWECWRRVGEKERKREIEREKEKERKGSRELVMLIETPIKIVMDTLEA